MLPRSELSFISGPVITTVTAFVLGVLLTNLWNHSAKKYSSEEEKHTDDNDTLRPAPRRHGAAIRLKPEQYHRYRQLHDDVWPQVLERMYQSNIRNFVIYYHEETQTLFQHFEWVGHWVYQTSNDQQEQTLFQADMEKISRDPITRKWWKECEPCQIPFSQWKTSNVLPSDGGNGKWWAPIECVAQCGHWPTAYSLQRNDPGFIKLLE